MMKKILAASMSLLLLLPGCAGTTAMGQHPGVTLLPTAELPAPARTDLSSASRPYYVGPFDKLEIDVFGVPEMKRQVQVDASGRVSFPLAGAIEAAGQTPSEVAADIEQRLRGSYVKDPQVTVNLVETVSQVVTVDGQVADPGLYPVVGRMTLARAVARAGGTTEFARLHDVIVFRTVEGKQYAGLYNLEAIRRGNYPDPEVFANDVVIVGDSKARRLFRDILQVVPLLTTPLVVLTNNNN